MINTIWRISRVIAESGMSKSTVYSRVKQGLFTPSLSLGGILVGWPSSEVSALNAARIAGLCDAEIKKLVVNLINQRRTANQNGKSTSP